MGDDTIYSGTVAAATEGFLLGIPSLAVSMSQHHATHFETAAMRLLNSLKDFSKTLTPSPFCSTSMCRIYRSSKSKA